MSWADLLTGFGNALPGAAQGALQTYAQTQQIDRQKKQDQQALDMKTLKLWADSDDPKLRSLAAIGQMRMADPTYKPPPKGMINDLTSKDLHAHPEFEQLSRAMDITHSLQQAHTPTSEAATPAAAPTAAPPPMGLPGATPETGSEMDLMPGGGAGAPGDTSSSSNPMTAAAAPPAPPPMLTPNPPDATGPSAGAAMPGATYGMPSGSMMTPNNPSTSTLPPPPPTGGPAAPASPAPAANAGAGMPISPVNGVHPELQKILKDAAGSSAVGDVKAAADETEKAFGKDILGGFGPRGDVAFKAGAQDRISRKDALRVAASQAAAKDKEDAADARAKQSAKDALERTTLRTDSAMTRLKEAERLRRDRPAKARQAPQMNVQKELVDIERDALKDKATVQKEIDHQLITVRAEAEKNFTSPAKLALLEEQIKTMGQDRLGIIDENKQKATEYLGNMMKPAGMPTPLKDKVPNPAAGSAKPGVRTVKRDAQGNLVLQ